MRRMTTALSGMDECGVCGGDGIADGACIATATVCRLATNLNDADGDGHATNLKWLDVRVLLRVTTTLMRRMTTVHVTSAHALVNPPVGEASGYTLTVEEHAVDVVPWPDDIPLVCGLGER